jgi:putative phosphoesterase
MIVGILSDTHGRFPAAKKGVDLLRARGAAYLIHCGDVGGEDILDLLADDPPSAAFVFGNNDYDREELARYAASIGVNCLHAFGTVALDGKQIAVTHGDNGSTLRRVLQAQEHDYLLIGHSHVHGEKRVGRVRVVNPGALHRASPKTVATLDTESDELVFIPVDAAN